MSVIVMGMQMPKVCIDGDYYGNCPMDRVWCAQRFAPKGYTKGQVYDDQQGKRPNWCPLRPLPEEMNREDLNTLQDSFICKKWGAMHDATNPSRLQVRPGPADNLPTIYRLLTRRNSGDYRDIARRDDTTN